MSKQMKFFPIEKSDKKRTDMPKLTVRIPKQYIDAVRKRAESEKTTIDKIVEWMIHECL